MEDARLHPERAVGASERQVRLMQGERNAARLARPKGNPLKTLQFPNRASSSRWARVG